MFWRDDITPGAGKYQVLLKRGEGVDESRGGRVIPYKIYHPDPVDEEKFPVIIWSHGFGGNRDGAAFLSRYLASYGYVIVHLTHIGTDSSLWEGKDGHPWDILRNANVKRETTLHRFKDVPFVLDSLPDWAAVHEDIGPYMDLDTLGMSGHSFGSMTTQAMAGQLFPDERDEITGMKEERFKAGILYSPVPIGHLTDEEPETLYGPIDIPMLHMTGTDDASPIEGFDYTHRLAVYEHSGHPEKYLLVKKGGDHMVYNGTRGKLDANPKREKHEEIVKIISLAFWDAFLKDDPQAKDWLASGAQEYLADEGELRAG